MHQQPQKKKAVLTTRTAFKDGPDSTGLNAKHYMECQMNLTYSAKQERQMNSTRSSLIKPSPLGLKTHIQRG